AMKYGVKHYLLKPTNRLKIENALQEVILELEAEREKESFINQVRKSFKKVVPIAKEHFLKEFIMNQSYGSQEWEYYVNLFNIDPIKRNLRLMLMAIDQFHEFEQLFGLKEIILKVIDQEIIYLSTMIGEKILILI